MQSLSLDDLPVVGAIDREVTDTGVVLRRVPEWARGQVADPMHQYLVAMPVGIRLEFRTTSRVLELEVNLTCFQVEGEPAIPAAFDLWVGGDLVQGEAATGATTVVIARDRSVSFVAGEPSTVRFELPEGADLVELWFPHAAVMELRAVRIDDGATLEPVVRDRPRWVHYGSSISHCLEAPSPTQTWPTLVAHAADVDLVSLAMAGNAMLDLHVARTIRDLPVDVISLKLGINIINADSMRERIYVPLLHGFLDTIRDGHPMTPIVLVTPIICPVAEDHPGPTIPDDQGQVGVVGRATELTTGALTLRRVRELMAEVVAVRGDANLHLIDGLALFGEADVDELPDGLHPSPAGYRLMAERFAELAFGEGGPLRTR